MGDTELRTWLTYAEAGQALGMRPDSAKRLSFRRHWPRRTGNDGLARVGVPAAELHGATGGNPGDVTGGAPDEASGDSSSDATGDIPGGAIKTSRDTAPVLAELLATELAHVRMQLATREGELAGLREALRIAEAGTHEAARRADRAEQAALDAWRTTTDLVRLLTQAKAPSVPAQVPPRRGWLVRLLG